MTSNICMQSSNKPNVHDQCVVNTTVVKMPHLNNHHVVHCDVNVTIVVVRVVQIDIQAEVDVVIGGRWTRECRGVRVVGAACVSHHAGQRNDSTTDRFLVACGVSRETNKLCKRVR